MCCVLLCLFNIILLTMLLQVVMVLIIFKHFCQSSLYNCFFQEWICIPFVAFVVFPRIVFPHVFETYDFQGLFSAFSSFSYFLAVEWVCSLLFPKFRIKFYRGVSAYLPCHNTGDMSLRACKWAGSGCSWGCVCPPASLGTYLSGNSYTKQQAGSLPKPLQRRAPHACSWLHAGSLTLVCALCEVV